MVSRRIIINLVVEWGCQGFSVPSREKKYGAGRAFSVQYQGNGLFRVSRLLAGFRDSGFSV